MMNRTPSALAWWHFALKGQSAWLDEDALRFAAMLATEAIDILGRHNLLRTERMEIVSWRTQSGESPGLARKNLDLPVTIPLSAVDEATLSATLLDQAQSGHGYPERVRFHGTGLVYDVNGVAHHVDDPVTLTLSTLVNVAVEVSTNLDVWLPYDLQAREQRVVSEQNRPRLRAALEDLAALDVNVGNSEVTKFAVVDGLHVRNHTNAFGQPVSVLQP